MRCRRRFVWPLESGCLPPRRLLCMGALVRAFGDRRLLARAPFLVQSSADLFGLLTDLSLSNGSLQVVDLSGLARLGGDVVVFKGLTRIGTLHLAGCVHLRGSVRERPLPAAGPDSSFPRLWSPPPLTPALFFLSFFAYSLTRL